MAYQTNIIRIKAVANALKEIKDEVVFIGGATVSLYADRPAFEIRPTDDIDIIVEILNYAGRAKLEEKLRLLGFSHDVESGIVCRYKIDGITVDIMPTNDPSIGFANKWYPDGFSNAIRYDLDERTTIKILAAPYFLATKIEAFKNRGQNDGRTSHDFEDIVYLLENRETLWEEIRGAKDPLYHYLQNEVKVLLNNAHLPEWIDSHVERSVSPVTPFIIEKLKAFVS